MRLVCREDHDEPPDLCPPHNFVAGWSKDTDGEGVLFCTSCGDVRALMPPRITAPVEESVPAQR